MKKLYYPAIFYKEKKGYHVQYIDFPDAYTSGDTLENAYYMAQDVISLIVDEYEKLPEPTLDYTNYEFEVDEEYKKHVEYKFITLVEIDLLEIRKRNSTKSVNTTVTMPEWLKKTAELNNINFSEILQKGIKEKLGIDKHINL